MAGGPVPDIPCAAALRLVEQSSKVKQHHYLMIAALPDFLPLRIQCPGPVLPPLVLQMQEIVSNCMDTRMVRPV